MQNNVIVLQVANQAVEMDIREYRGQRVITLADVDRVHGRPEGTAGRTFRAHRERFEAGVHCFEVPYEEWSQVFGPTLNVEPNDDPPLDILGTMFGGTPNVPPKGGHRGSMVFLTERGYLKLVKPFTDDRSWEVQDQLIECYFRVKALAAVPFPQVAADQIVDRVLDRLLPLVGGMGAQPTPGLGVSNGVVGQATLDWFNGVLMVPEVRRELERGYCIARDVAKMVNQYFKDTGLFYHVPVPACDQVLRRLAEHEARTGPVIRMERAPYRNYAWFAFNYGTGWVDGYKPKY